MQVPLRSVLYMPGSNQRAMDKARGLAADAIVFDLEDAVAPAAKVTARSQVCAQLAAGAYGRRLLVVRCNGVDSAWLDDDLVALAAQPALSTVCIPKVESAQQLDRVYAALAAAGREDVDLWAMLETPRGIREAFNIARHHALSALVMGTTDLAAELRVPHRADRLGLQYALGVAVLAAREAGVAVLDGVHLDLADDEGLAAVCAQGRALGFDGKTLIHPRQISVANEAFGLSAQTLNWARDVLSAWEEAVSAGSGLAVLDGKLVELMHVEEARRTLAMAERIAELEKAGAP